MNDKYVKVVYKSDPIGPERIVLYLTTFDTDALQRDEEIKKQEYYLLNIDRNSLKDMDFVKHIEMVLQDYVKDHYDKYIEELHETIKSQNKCISELLEQLVEKNDNRR